jgi:capsule polysaccharide export protein KpsE/RkpR
MEERTKSLERALQERADTEAAKITEVLEELRRSIVKELHAPEQQLQLELFTTSEMEQFERNVDSLKARIEQIPKEIEQESAAIRARFKDPVPRLFPLAVTYLVPKKYEQGRGL